MFKLSRELIIKMLLENESSYQNKKDHHLWFSVITKEFVGPHKNLITETDRFENYTERSPIPIKQGIFCSPISRVFIENLYPKLMSETNPDDWSLPGIVEAINAVIDLRKSVIAENHERAQLLKVAAKRWLNTIYGETRSEKFPTLKYKNSLYIYLSNKTHAIGNSVMKNPKAIYFDTDMIMYQLPDTVAVKSTMDSIIKVSPAAASDISLETWDAVAVFALKKYLLAKGDVGASGAQRLWKT